MIQKLVRHSNITTLDEMVDQMTGIVKTSMEETLSQTIPEMPFEVEIKVAEAWR